MKNSLQYHLYTVSIIKRIWGIYAEDIWKISSGKVTVRLIINSSETDYYIDKKKSLRKKLRCSSEHE